MDGTLEGIRLRPMSGRCKSLVGPRKIGGWRKSRAKDLKTGGQQIYHSLTFNEDSLGTASI